VVRYRCNIQMNNGTIPNLHITNACCITSTLPPIIHDCLNPELQHDDGLHGTGTPCVGCRKRQDALGVHCGLDLDHLYHCCPRDCVQVSTSQVPSPRWRYSGGDVCSTETGLCLMKEDARTTPHALTMNNTWPQLHVPYCTYHIPPTPSYYQQCGTPVYPTNSMRYRRSSIYTRLV
jgi:hypothetical protein